MDSALLFLCNALAEAPLSRRVLDGRQARRNAIPAEKQDS
jgi:hypothetical protein